MRRYVTIGSIVVATVLAGSATAYAEPAVSARTASAQPAPAPAGCPTDPAGPSAPADPEAPPAPPAPPAVPADPAAPGVPTVPVAPAAPADPVGSPIRSVVAAHDPGGDEQDGDEQDGDEQDGDAQAGGDAATGRSATEQPATVPAEDAGAVDDACGPETSAATKYGWGTPNRVDEFDGGLGPDWDVYEGTGHNGQGRRTPDAVTVKDGIMTITGDADGNTAGLAWNPGQKYGRWEGRVRAPVGDSSYNALMLLWPDAENWPVGGEVDFMEMSATDRQSTDMFLHYGENNDQVQGSVDIDATQWHNWAVEWAPTHIAAFVDGREWWRTTDTSILPPGPMHLCIQLDWFPEGGAVTETRMEVAWVKQYPLASATEGLDRVVDTVVRPLTEGAPDPLPAVRGPIAR